MIIHVGTEVNILFGVLDNGNVIQKIPYKIELGDFSDEAIKKLQDTFLQLKSDLDKHLNQEKAKEKGE